MTKQYSINDLVSIADHFYRKHGHYPPSVIEHAKAVLIRNGIPSEVAERLLQGKRDFAVSNAS